jgi:hypothetical protein
METLALRRPVRTPDRRRRALEAAGWRTWLTYSENHERDLDGRMTGVDGRWTVELEHLDGRSLSVQASSVSAAWWAACRAVRTS